MKLRKHICTAALLGVALAFISVGTTAVAQGLQPPFMAPTPPSLNYGVFYFSAGAKYRNLHTFTMNVSGGPSTIVVNPGTVPFGPTTAGDFGVGIGRPGFDGTAERDPMIAWIYDNGHISGDVIPGRCRHRLGVGPALPNTCEEPDPPRHHICNAGLSMDLLCCIPGYRTCHEQRYPGTAVTGQPSGVHGQLCHR